MNLPGKSILIALFFIAGIVILSSCNKDFENAAAPAQPANTGQTIDAIIKGGSNYLILQAAIAKAGLDSVLNIPNNSLTLFAPDDDAFALSGITPATIQALPQSEVQQILSYHIIPNSLPSALIPNTFPNTQMPTMLQLDPLNPLFTASVFPWKTSAGQLYANNIPITTADQLASNGVIHNVAAVLTPPSALLAQLIYGDTSLTYLSAAIARADSGQVGLNRIDSLLKYPFVNMTVLAPNNAAFQNILFEEIYGALLEEGVPSSNAAIEAGTLSSSPSVFSTPALYGVLTAQTVRGILVYHLLAINAGGTFQPLDRVFSVNFPTTPGSFVTTLLNNAYPTQPGVEALATFTGPVVSSLQFTGLGTFPPGGTPYSGTPANTVKFDEIGVNGVIHVIDAVLLPE